MTKGTITITSNELHKTEDDQVFALGSLRTQILSPQVPKPIYAVVITDGYRQLKNAKGEKVRHGFISRLFNKSRIQQLDAQIDAAKTVIEESKAKIEASTLSYKATQPSWSDKPARDISFTLPVAPSVLQNAFEIAAAGQNVDIKIASDFSVKISTSPKLN